MIKILAIDDRKSNLFTLKELIKSSIKGSVVFTAHSGEEGIMLAKEKQPDVILLDVIIPEMDGYETCKRLKEEAATRNIPVILLSAMKTDPKNRLKGIEVGADAFLSKPIDPFELTAQIKVMHRIKRAEDKLRAEKETLEDRIKEGLTELGKSEKRARENAALLKTILESPEGIIIFSLDNNYCYTSFTESHRKTMKAIWGVDIEIGMNMLGAIQNTLDRAKAKINFDKTLKGENLIIIEAYGDEKLLRTYWENRYSPIYGAHGLVTGLTVFVTDISERKRAEEALIESEKRFEAFMNQIPAGIFIKDANGKYLYSNQYSEYSHNIVNWKDKSAYDFFPKELADKYTQEDKRALHGESLLSEGSVVSKLGHTIYFRNITFGIDQADGTKLIGGISLDITKEKEAEEELQLLNEKLAAQNEEYQVLNEELKESLERIQKINSELKKAKEKAEESDRLKSAFLANMSHEIRTPMNGILGFTSLLEDTYFSAEEKFKFIENIKKSGQRMLNTVNDIIDISRIEAGVMDLSIKAVNVKKQAESQYGFFKPQAEEKGLKLVFNNTLTYEQALIRTDERKLDSILTNLIKNAIKFTDKGIIEFGYRLKQENTSATLEFYVKDTGIGIPANRMRAVFNRFEQADIEDRRAFQGSGLGLPIAKAYVELLGGKIWVDSEVGKGSAFYFTIPYLPAEQEKMPTEIVAPEYNKTSKSGKQKVLIVEDDEISTRLLKVILGNLFGEILVAETGREAIEISKNNPDIRLILMDIKLPDIDGYETTREIKQFNQQVYIIAQTANAMKGDKEKAIEAGCNDYISKPIAKDELIGKIKGLL